MGWYMVAAKLQPVWVCWECGTKHKAGEWRELSTWHTGVCGVCCNETAVTEARDCQYLKDSWIKDSEKCLNKK